MKRFCPRCGREAERTIKGICLECFLEKNPVLELPEELKFEQCRNCGKSRFKGKWLSPSKDELRGFIASRAKPRGLLKPTIEVILAREGEFPLKATVRVGGKIEGENISLEREVCILPVQAQCDGCMRVSSYYHEAVLQVRFGERPSRQLRAETEDKVRTFLEGLHSADSLAAVVDVKEDRKGFDVLVGGKRAARRTAEFLARKSGSKIKTSYTLTGVSKDGKEKKRFTFCVRL